jgi:hypothetical protein
MIVANTQNSGRFDRLTLWSVLIAVAIGLLTLSRAYSPQELGSKMRLASTVLTWGPLLAVALIWILKLPWRASALAWFLAWSAEIGAAILLVVGASAIYHFSVLHEFAYLQVFLPFVLAGILLLLVWGFLQRREWALRAATRLCQIVIALSLLDGLFSGISASEFRFTIECVVLWYWLSRPQIQELFTSQIRT